MKIVFWRSLLKIKFKNLQIFLKIVFLRSLLKIKLKNLQIFFEDFILKITFEDQVQKLQIFFEVDHKSDPQNTIFIRSLQIFELCHAKWSNYPNSK